MLVAACGTDTSGVDRYERSAAVATGFEGYRADIVAAEKAVEQCMEALGFHYDQANPTGADLDGVFATSLFLDDPDSVSTGYGSVLSYRRMVSVIESGTSFEDLEDLPQEQQAAYRRALYGEGGSAGCAAQGAAAVPLRSLRSDFIREFNELHQLVVADPRWVEANRQWSECMADAGYEFADQLDARSYINRRIESEVGNPLQLNEKKLAALADIAEEDRRIAAADAECQQEQEEVFRSIWEEYAVQFVEEHDALIHGLLPE